MNDRKKSVIMIQTAEELMMADFEFRYGSDFAEDSSVSTAPSATPSTPSTPGTSGTSSSMVTLSRESNLLNTQVSASSGPVGAYLRVHGLSGLMPSTILQAATNPDFLRNRRSISPESPTGPSSFFKKILVEVRRMIYAYLHVNPLLGKPDAISRQFKSGATQKYGLSPAALQTCKQWYDEASKVLYGRNTFIISCIGHRNGNQGDGKGEIREGDLLECPLTRYERRTYLTLSKFGARPEFKKVHHWKVMISLFAATEEGPTTSLLDFCCFVFDTQPKFITVLTTGKDFCAGWTGFRAFSVPRVTDEPFEATSVLAPLKLLRNVKQLTFEVSGGEEIPYDVQLDVKAVAESNDPSPLCMYLKLLNYAQTFEEHVIFREDMGTVRWHCRADVLFKRPDNAFLPMSPLDLKLLNPFKASVTHPVENALELAKFACDENDLQDFKLQRKTVLEYLEPQYKRIAISIYLLRSFVKKHKEIVDGKPDILHRHALYFSQKWAEIGEEMEDIVEAMILVEDCTKAFVRDLTPEIRRLVRLHQERFDKCYDGNCRESNMAILREAYNDGCARRWYCSLKRAADSVVKQYLSIRKSRKELFDFDAGEIGDRGCEIDIETWRDDEVINWESEED
ncbi:hypothetical protein BKA61DRAFT_673235 [Leptodontidium sp. MPI-SDFR-AT-0119]|nr:hypothetical protein BKA61DRAFT_673235 [Leptodontidium sp. MPI-SDFR-AT-0119]